MKQPLTPERLAEIHAREQAATKGPWGTSYDGKGTHTIQSGCRISLTAGFTSDGDIATLHGEHGDGQTYANATFLAYARRDVPELLAELDRVRAERDAWSDWTDTLAYKVAPVEVLGTHEGGQLPWSDALDMLTPAAEVDKLRAELDRVHAERDRYRNAWRNARTRAADGHIDADRAEQSRERWRAATLKAEAERDELKKRANETA
ncbi:hypothetical protein ACFW81_24020 [Streptomyces angustmyceticus]|uniref:hypothetical protein n=1 Tax=Streptomyces angustmyceticus TaxID=285578 RepID=UPI003686ACFE